MPSDRERAMGLIVRILIYTVDVMLTMLVRAALVQQTAVPRLMLNAPDRRSSGSRNGLVLRDL